MPAMKKPITFFGVEAAIWIVVVGGWLNMDCETGDGARIAAYTAGLAIFGVASVVNYAVNGDNS